MLTGMVRKRRAPDVDETAGLGDDKFHELEEALAKRTVERFKEDAQSLLEQMDPENAPRVYSLLEDLSTAARDWTSKLTGHGMKPQRGGLGLYEDVGYVDNETWGAKAMDQLTNIFGALGKDQQVAGLVKALKTAKDGGMDDVAAKIQKKLDELLGDVPALPEPAEASEDAEETEESDEAEVIDEMPPGTEAVIQ